MKGRMKVQNPIEYLNALDNNIDEIDEQLTREMLEAAASAMEFWDNPWDDADWNDNEPISSVKIEPTPRSQNL